MKILQRRLSKSRLPYDVFGEQQGIPCVRGQ
jgi:hypothetical protein